MINLYCTQLFAKDFPLLSKFRFYFDDRRCWVKIIILVLFILCISKMNALNKWMVHTGYITRFIIIAYQYVTQYRYLCCFHLFIARWQIKRIHRLQSFKIEIFVEKLLRRPLMPFHTCATKCITFFWLWSLFLMCICQIANSKYTY